eukprot:jgi/Botrbrau1/372/Bobra.110_2s0028.1
MASDKKPIKLEPGTKSGTVRLGGLIDGDSGRPPGASLTRKSQNGPQKRRFMPGGPCQQVKKDEPQLKPTGPVPSKEPANNSQFQELIARAMEKRKQETERDQSRHTMSTSGAAQHARWGTGISNGGLPQGSKPTNKSVRFADDLPSRGRQGGLAQVKQEPVDGMWQDAGGHGEGPFDYEAHPEERKDTSGDFIEWDPSQYYPTTLPFRRPVLGASEDEEPRWSPMNDAFEEECDQEDTAERLRLLKSDELGGGELMLFQLPSILPAPPSTSDRKPADTAGSDSDCMSLRDLPAGKIGKLLVFKSGAVKLQLGNVLLDVTACGESGIQQEVICINGHGVDKGHQGDIIFLGGLHHKVVASPNIDQLLNNSGVPDWPRNFVPLETLGSMKAEALPEDLLPEARASPAKKRNYSPAVAVKDEEMEDACGEYFVAEAANHEQDMDVTD